MPLRCFNGPCHGIDAGGKDILTIEGFAEGGELHPLQSSFVEKGGLQCGFCTPGMILTARAILNEEENPTEDVIKRKMAGNLCRCTGYKKIVEAVMSANESDENAGRPEGQEA